MASIHLVTPSIANAGNYTIDLPKLPDSLLLGFKLMMFHGTFGCHAVLFYDETYPGVYSESTSVWLGQAEQFYHMYDKLVEPTQLKNLHIYIYNGTGGAIYVHILLHVIKAKDYLRSHEGM